MIGPALVASALAFSVVAWEGDTTKEIVRRIIRRHIDINYPFVFTPGPVETDAGAKGDIGS